MGITIRHRDDPVPSKETQSTQEKTQNSYDLDSAGQQLGEYFMAYGGDIYNNPDAMKLREEYLENGGNYDHLKQFYDMTTNSGSGSSGAFTSGSSWDASDTKHVSQPGQQNAPDTIDSSFMTALAINGKGNSVTITQGNSTVEKFNTDKINKTDTIQSGDIVNYGGVSYIAVEKNGEIIGQRLLNYGSVGEGAKTVNMPDGSTKEIERVEQTVDKNGNVSYNVILKEEQKVYDNNDNYYYYEPDPPSPPKPTYTDVSLYSYLFGIDSISMSHSITHNTAYFISDDIDIGTIKDVNNLMLDASEYSPAGTSIEYYIIDNNKDIPILPRGRSVEITDELVFNGLPTRFSPTKIIEIKENGKVNNELSSLDDIKFSNKNDTFAVSYTTTESAKKYSPINQKIKIKAILRKYSDDVTSPYIKYINLVKVGGGSLWEDI